LLRKSVIDDVFEKKVHEEVGEKDDEVLEAYEEEPIVDSLSQ
jgi:hypothetical protein